MSWFEEQLQSRRINDEKVIATAYEAAVNSVLGERFSFDEASDAVSLILQYYHLSGVKLPDGISDENEKLNTVCRLSGLMRRTVALDSGWHRNAFGAFLGKLRDGGEYVALIPDSLGGYSYYNHKQHKKIKLNSKTEKLLENEAICFYKPLPAKKLSAVDLIRFGVSSWSASDYIFTVILLIAATLIGLMTPKLGYFLFSEVAGGKDITLLISTVTFFACLGVASAVIEAMRTVFTLRTQTKTESTVKSAILMRVLSLPAEFFRRYSSGEILQRMEYAESVCAQAVNMIFSTGLSGLFSLAYISQILDYTPSLVIPSLCIIAVNMIFSVVTTFRQMKISKKQLELGARNSGIALATVSGVQKIKLAGAEKRLFARWVNAFSEQTRVTYNPPLFLKINSTIATAISLVGSLIIYYIAIQSDVGPAEFYAFQTAYAMVAAAISSLVSIAINTAKIKPSLEMAQPILEALPETDIKSKAVTTLRGAIELNNVSFAYPGNDKNVIDDLSLKIKAGQYIAIVGKTGCGKSTLVRLLLGFEKPQTGAIYYDGIDINTMEKRSLRRMIGTVMQDDRLFMGDIYSNIVICAPNLPLASAWEAADIAGIGDDIRAMPMGMNTFIPDGSGGISGGQRQRLLIARAIAPKPKILIFDEATSALDNITQKKVSEALDALKCTRIVIAHRLSTIRRCDRILVMDGGHIAEEGTYDELVAKNGYFAELVERQRLDKES